MGYFVFSCQKLISQTDLCSWVTNIKQHLLFLPKLLSLQSQEGLFAILFYLTSSFQGQQSTLSLLSLCSQCCLNLKLGQLKSIAFVTSALEGKEHFHKKEVNSKLRCTHCPIFSLLSCSISSRLFFQLQKPKGDLSRAVP